MFFKSGHRLDAKQFVNRVRDVLSDNVPVVERTCCVEMDKAHIYEMRC